MRQPPIYGPHEYGNPANEAVFGVLAERVHQALQRTRAEGGRLRTVVPGEPGSRRRPGAARDVEPPMSALPSRAQLA
ncbi:hypothetical protein ACFV2N_18440 [Streptomyces sp. NPDC059680]|uniref:hypothetical protein n=1 Tax=Streptomyces sp. NPDC059680 TaxID=3346904 RepID=UPI0036AF9784